MSRREDAKEEAEDEPYDVPGEPADGFPLSSVLIVVFMAEEEADKYAWKEAEI